LELNCKITKKLKAAQYLKEIFLGKFINRFQGLQEGAHYVELEKNHSLNIWKRID
jgi:hypothetical protein